MDPERPHRSTSINNSSSSSNTTSTTSELFICFTSRLSSSSMKISSKSILSPGRTREPSQISLSSSLSRRLRSNGSMKGGQASPMFPTNGKKRGCGFENPEPSSPKVTCIGQVRVKTKKQGKKFRACRSKRRGEVSFRKVDHNNGSNSVENTSSCQDYNMGHFLSNNNNNSLHQQHQQQQECKKWVHLPLTICEALRAFGAEFNCFLPCRSSCMANNQRDKEEKTGGSGSGNNNRNGNGSSSSSCGAVFARWLVAVQEGEGEGKGREIELVVGGEEEDEIRRDSISSEMMMRSSQRRHVFENIDLNDCGDENMGDEEEARVSICIPPKNALLLMRCRSDPVKMAALANKFWEAPMPKDEEVEEEEAENGIEEKEEEEEEVQKDVVNVEREGKEVKFEEGIEYQEVSEISEMFVSCEATEEQEIPEVEAETEAESSFGGVVEEKLETSLKEENFIECQDQAKENEVEEDHQESMKTEETFPEVPLDLQKLQREEDVPDIEQETEEEQPQEEEETEAIIEEEFEENEKKQEEENTVEYQAIAEEVEEEEEEEEEGGASPPAAEEQEAETTQGRSELECPETREPDPVDESKESESQQNLLPDCLLLMMCEPKLSMEVSKETWVCSTDFIRWLPERKKPQPVVKQKDGGDEPKRRISIDSNKAPPILLQPARSSCSFPAAPPMATAAAANGPGGGAGSKVIDQKLVGGGKGFVLTRCKSEPRKSSAKLAPDACFWKNRKLEPATLGVGAAGVGF
ncbi:hypothetical protein CCACVL1_16412 [Corchorus capsularis]|uniref:Uncharacterized protein n=1 Tax=Corchorus capsularis TaxID=210143 RepID=A0A1R3HXB7_COCAP|nr:hypothetical protein CCACVL1_16412 [Corchorus capsularis]